MRDHASTSVCVWLWRVVRIAWLGAGTPTQIVCAMLVTITAIAVTQSLNPFVVDSDDVVAILAQYVCRGHAPTRSCSLLCPRV